MLNAEFTLNKILNRLENLSFDKSRKYNKKECINSKPVLQAGSETLEEYRCELPLHVNFCNPKKVIDLLIKQSQSEEAFEWVYKGDYKGGFVIENVSVTVVTQVKDLIIFAKVNFNLIEKPKNEDFLQQITGEADYSSVETFSENSNRIKDFGSKVKESFVENMKSSVATSVMSGNITDTAYNLLNDTLLGVLNDIIGGNIVDVYSIIEEKTDEISAKVNLNSTDRAALVSALNSVPGLVLDSAIRKAV